MISLWGTKIELSKYKLNIILAKYIKIELLSTVWLRKSFDQKNVLLIGITSQRYRQILSYATTRYKWLILKIHIYLK